MGLVGNSGDNSFSLDNLGDLDFDEILTDISFCEHAILDQKISNINFNTVLVFARESDFASLDKGYVDFYEAKQFVKLDKQQLSSSEKILTGILLEREGQKPVIMTRAGEARHLDQRVVKIHRETDNGTEIVRHFERRDIIIGSLTNEQYARIHHVAMTNLTFIARQLKEIDSKEKSEAKMNKLLSQRGFTQGLPSNQSSFIDKFFQGQSNFFSEHRRSLERLLDQLAFEERTVIERKTKKLDKEYNLRMAMRESKEEHEAERNEDVRLRETRAENDR